MQTLSLGVPFVSVLAALETLCLLSPLFFRPVYIESRVCVVKGVVKCSFEYLCVVRHDTRRRHNVGVGEGTIKKNS